MRRRVVLAGCGAKSTARKTTGSMEHALPHFYFHYHTAEGPELDDVGCSFDTLELAYIDAYRSMIEIGAELLKDQINPASHRIEITDRHGTILMELPFDDVFRQRQLEPPVAVKVLRLPPLNARRRLKGELEDACAVARASVAMAHETLRRARATR